MIQVERFLGSVLVITPQKYCDSRGSFLEKYNVEIGSVMDHPAWKQENQSHSKKNVFRGMHYQIPPKAQAKLVSCVKGSVVDIIVDVQEDSPTYKNVFSITLTDDNNKMVYIPQGFAHGFYATSEEAVLQYKCDEVYSKEHERGFNYKDPILTGVIPEDIKWIVSDKDSQLPFI